MMESSLKISVMDGIPSAIDFSRLEAANVPVVFKGCVFDWPAISKWNPSANGLEYLEHKVGSSLVEVMLSRSGSVFYGDIRSHERMSIPFSHFIRVCKKHEKLRKNIVTMSEEQEKFHLENPESLEALLDSEENGSRIYLAQVPVLSKERKEESPLEVLLEDINMPQFLDTNSISHINLWMNIDWSRSSTHYDPYHNLLCVVAGWKKVLLWPPSATHLLYPMAIYGESSNHSATDPLNPNLAVYPLAKHALDFSQEVTLQAGDALFLPEGWFHQVDSNNLTIAINYWWQSRIMRSMASHMEVYYLRRIIGRLIDHEREQMLRTLSISCVQDESKKTHMDNVYNVNKQKPEEKSLKEPFCGLSIRHAEGFYSENIESTNQRQSFCIDECMPQKKVECLTDSLCSLEDAKEHAPHRQISCTMNVTHGNGFERKFTLESLDVYESHVLNILISNVHERMSNFDHSILGSNVGGENANDNERLLCTARGTSSKAVQSEPPYAGDVFAKILIQLKASTLQKLLLVMINQFPRTLEALVLCALSPIGVDILTRKFEEMDNEIPKEQQQEFYRLFYNVFNDHHVALEAILNGKEHFAYMALKRVLELNLGISLCDVKKDH